MVFDGVWWQRLLVVLVLGSRVALRVDLLVKLPRAVLTVGLGVRCLELGVCCAALVRSHVFFVCWKAADL